MDLLKDILNPDILWTNVAGDGFIALAYFMISFGLYYFVRRRKMMRFPGIFILFSVFLFLSGTMHVLNIINHWHPLPAIRAIVKISTGVFSVIAAIAIIRIIPVALKIPSPQQLAENNSKLEHYLSELKAQNEFLRQLAYATYHDLREPLRGMTINSQVLMLRHKYEMDGEMQRITEHIASESKRMYHSIDSIMKLTFLESEKYRFKEVKLEDVLKATEERLETLIDENNVTIRGTHLPVIKGNEALLIMLFESIITNSIRFRSEVDPVIEIMAVAENGQYKIVFTDNGIGFDNKYRNQVFEMFRYLGNSKKYRGSGLGLAISRRIVQIHKGEISAFSEEGVGTTITVCLSKFASTAATAEKLASPVKA